MSVLNSLSKVAKDGFDPKKDKIRTSDRLDAGTYPVALKAVTNNVNKNNDREELAITLEVVSGDSKGRQEFINLCFDSDLHEFILDRNAKTLWTIAEMANVNLKGVDDDLASIANRLKDGIGKQFKMILTLSKNKKNPDFPYRNYEFEALDFNEPGEIQEDDFPF